MRKKLEELSRSNRWNWFFKIDEALFRKTVKDYIKACDEDDEVEYYNFSELTFPEISFEKEEFLKVANFKSASFGGLTIFNDASFSREANFKSASFSQGTSFNEASFLSEGNFRSVSFSRIADFELVSFSDDVDFSGVSFSGEAIFESASFGGLTIFNDASFSREANFDFASFLKNAFFQFSHFSFNTGFRNASFLDTIHFESVSFGGSTHFNQASFSEEALFTQASFSSLSVFTGAKFNERINFTKCTFGGEVYFDKAFFPILSNPPSFAGNDEYKPVNLSETVLEAAYIGDIDVLHQYIFKEAVILGVSLAGKKLIDCDFTGAVMKRVYTDEWEPDEATIKNTKYIYTDYRWEELEDEEGNKRKVRVALEESRVPADGFFGEGDNEGFTIKEYFHRPYEWNYALDLPLELRSTILNAVQFFREYAEKAKNEHVDIATRPEGKKVRIIFQVESEKDRERVEGLFREYVEKLFSAEEFVLEIENQSLEEYEILELQRKTNFLHQSLIVELGHQMQLVQGAKEGLVKSLSPIVDAESIMAYTERLVDKMGDIGIKQLTVSSESKSEASATATAINKTEVSISVQELIGELEKMKGNEELKDMIEVLQQELKEIRDDAKAGKAKEARERWAFAGKTIQGMVETGSKVLDLVTKMNDIFGGAPPV